MSFALATFTTAHIRSFSVRSEHHGNDLVPAVDIGFRITGSNHLLNLFDAGLRVSLYKRAANDPDQPDLDGIDPLTELPALRTGSLEMPIRLSAEYIGRNLCIDYGVGGKSNIELSGDADTFTVDAKDGGSVEINFRFKASGLDDIALGKLGVLLKHDVKITLMSSAQADGTQETLPESPFKYSVPPEGGIVDNHPQDATEAFIAANEKATEKALQKDVRAALAKRSGSAAKKAGKGAGART